MHAEFSGSNSGDGVPICLLIACDLVISAVVRRLKSRVAILLDKRKSRLSVLKPAFSGVWLPIVDTYRTFCLAPSREIREIFESVAKIQISLVRPSVMKSWRREFFDEIRKTTKLGR